MGFRVQGLGCLGLTALGLRVFEALGLGFRVWGSGCSGFRIYGLRVLGLLCGISVARRVLRGACWGVSWVLGCLLIAFWGLLSVLGGIHWATSLLNRKCACCHP